MAGKTVLVTGASGLLGRAIYKSLKEIHAVNTIGLCFSRVKDDLIKLDLTNDKETGNFLRSKKPDLIIHSAAERRPDIVEKLEEQTQKLNVQATENICNCGLSLGAPVLFISTDYVFDGKDAPYKEDALPNPLNKYGRSKLDGETTVLGKSDKNIVLRVPLLYGDVESLDESAVTILFPKSEESIRGVYHWSGEEMMTKYDMALAMADVFGLPSAHIRADPTPSAGACRPYDAHLASDRLEQLGATQRTPFKEGIKSCLQTYL